MAPTNASAATEPMDGKEKPSRNLDMEGQRVRTTKPPRNTRTIAALAQRIAEELRRPNPKEVAHNNCPYGRTAKAETVQKETVSTNSQPPGRITGSRERGSHSQKTQKPKVPGLNNVVIAKLEQQRQGRERTPPPPPKKKEGRFRSTGPQHLQPKPRQMSKDELRSGRTK